MTEPTEAEVLRALPSLWPEGLTEAQVLAFLESKGPFVLLRPATGPEGQEIISMRYPSSIGSWGSTGIIRLAAKSLG